LKIGCPEMFVRNYHSKLWYIPEECRSWTEKYFDTTFSACCLQFKCYPYSYNVGTRLLQLTVAIHIHTKSVSDFYSWQLLSTFLQSRYLTFTADSSRCSILNILFSLSTFLHKTIACLSYKTNHGDRS
jgi:hypothetical protein